MSDSVDLRKVLESWPYDAENDTRLTQGDDGRSILQVRTPLGLEQFELDGRPDGARPRGKESALEFHWERLEAATAAGKESSFELSPSDCVELFQEGTLYYFRYIRLFQMKDWARTVRDTARNLRVFDFVHRHAQRDEDQQFLEKWRPYVIRINTCAAVMLELDRNAHEKALQLAEEAVQRIQALEELEDDTFRFERERSLTALRELVVQIRKNRPLSKLEKLEQQLRRAVDKEEFERAAQLRDRIRALRSTAE
jgi:hypothetical protein